MKPAALRRAARALIRKEIAPAAARPQQPGGRHRAAARAHRVFGYGLSLDVKNAPMAVVLEDTSPTAADVLAGLWLSPYLSPVAHDARCARPRR